MEAIFVFSLVWGVGATGHAADRARFDVFLRELASGRTPAGYELEVPKEHIRLNTPMMPAGNSATVFDWMFCKERSDWRLWAEIVQAAEIPADAKFADIIIPTKDSCRYTLASDSLTICCNE